MEFYIGFSSSTSPLALIGSSIRAVEKRPYNHVYIKYECLFTKETIIAQASHGYVNECSLANFELNNKRIKEYKIVCSDADFLKILKFIKRNLGAKYSRAQVLLILIKKLTRFKFKEINKHKYYICSEFAAYVAQSIGILIESDLDYITPSDLDTILQNAGLKYEMV